MPYLLPSTSYFSSSGEKEVNNWRENKEYNDKAFEAKTGMRSEHKKELKVHFKYASDVNLTTETKKKMEEQSSTKLNWVAIR